MERYPERPCLGERPVVNGVALPFTYLTYRQVADEVAALSSAYLQLGIKPKQTVAVFGANCKEWMIAMQVRGRGGPHPRDVGGGDSAGGACRPRLLGRTAQRLAGAGWSVVIGRDRGPARGCQLTGCCCRPRHV